MKNNQFTGKGTRAVHAGVEPDPSTGAIMTPIFQTSTYVQEAVGVHKGWEYSRSHNPTRAALESALATLENGTHGLAFASGLAAIDTVLKTLKPGDEVISGEDLYGGTARLFRANFAPMGIVFHFVDTQQPALVEAAINEKTRLVWLESPTNPVMQITDIAAIAALTKPRGILLAVDNTFASPMLQRPIEHGADIVMHSVTKYLGGHSDVVMGALISASAEINAPLQTIQNNCGAIAQPFDSFLVLRGLKTLHLRIERHCANGRKIAHWLCEHPGVGKVYWPGLEDHPGHDIAARQMDDFGGMIGFEIATKSEEQAKAIVASTELFTLAESLGGVESLIEHPAAMTHASVSAEVRAKLGISGGFIRLSVGVEDAKDLIADLDQAFKKAGV
ncbi:MAG: cystathionine gamma-synthase [Flavobacteriales bacterium]|jgi:cystathionine gamma-lyase|nr:cystathionine gamma-synthase [Flavobacteriales bacterium]